MKEECFVSLSQCEEVAGGVGISNGGNKNNLCCESLSPHSNKLTIIVQGETFDAIALQV